MKKIRDKNKLQIINILIEHISKFPEHRFAQILFNLDINQFKENKDELRDIYNDLDEEILKRIKGRIDK